MAQKANPGTPVSPEHMNHLLSLAREDPTLTNVELSRIGKERFERQYDPTTIRDYRDKAKIPSSREARKLALGKAILSHRDREYLGSLLEKIRVIDPDTARMTDTMREAGSGQIGTRNQNIWVNHDRGKVTAVWLRDNEVEWMKANLPTKTLRTSFSKLRGRGTKVIQKILRYNFGRVMGEGGISFQEMLQILETRKPDALNVYEKITYCLWLKHVALARSIERFKQNVEQALAPPAMKS